MKPNLPRRRLSIASTKRGTKKATNLRLVAERARAAANLERQRKQRKPIVGKIYVHPHGLRYQVVKLLFSATGYERTGKVTPVVLYKQLDRGKFPPGTLWVRAEKDFLKVFK